jgi:hypothetical protein
VLDTPFFFSPLARFHLTGTAEASELSFDAN